MNFSCNDELMLCENLLDEGNKFTRHMEKLVKGITPEIANARKEKNMNLRKTNPHLVNTQKRLNVIRQQKDRLFNSMDGKILGDLRGKTTPSGKKITNNIISSSDESMKFEPLNKFAKMSKSIVNTMYAMFLL